MQRLVKRMTRFYVTAERDQVVDDMNRACIQLGYTQKKQGANTFNISTTDRRNKHLVFRVALLDIDGLLLDFRLSKVSSVILCCLVLQQRNRITPARSNCGGPSHDLPSVKLTGKFVVNNPGSTHSECDVSYLKHVIDARPL